MSNAIKKLINLLPIKIPSKNIPEIIAYLKKTPSKNFQQEKKYNFNQKKTTEDLILKIKEIEDIGNPDEDSKSLVEKKFTLGFILCDLSENTELRGFEYEKIDWFKRIKEKEVLKNNFLIIKKGTVLRHNLLFLENSNTFFLCEYSGEKDLEMFFSY